MKIYLNLVIIDKLSKKEIFCVRIWWILKIGKMREELRRCAPRSWWGNSKEKYYVQKA